MTVLRSGYPEAENQEGQVVSSIPVCPILSIRSTQADELCLQGDCALYLPAAKKCSLVYIGFKAMMDVQKLQQQTAAPKPPGA